MKLNDFNFCLHYHIKDVVSISFLKKSSDHSITYLNVKHFGLICISTEYWNKAMFQYCFEQKKTKPVKQYNCFIVYFLSEAGIFFVSFLKCPMAHHPTVRSLMTSLLKVPPGKCHQLRDVTEERPGHSSESLVFSWLATLSLYWSAQ